MKKNAGRIVTLVLFGALLASCGGEAAAPDESVSQNSAAVGTETAAEEAPEEASVIAAEDFGGRKINIMTYGWNDYMTSTPDVAAADYTGDGINDAVYDRNAALAEKFNIELTYTDTEGNFASLLKNSVLADDGAYDLAFLSATGASTQGLNGCLMDVHALPNLALDKPWWNSSLLNSSSIAGVNYFLIGDMNVGTWTQSYAVYFNKKLAQDLDMPDLYDIVNTGKWTIDELDTLTRRVYQDLNGNGEYDENDLYGLTACSVCVDCFWASADVNFVVSDGDALTLQFTDTYYGLWDKMVSLLQAPEMLYTDRPQYTAKRDTYDRGAFLEDRALFFMEGLCIADTRLREMKSDYGILPLPKYDENQKNYRTYSHANNNSTVAFPVTAEKDIDMLTKVVEDMAYFSSKTVRPAYYEKLLSGKIARDENSIAMLDIITNNVVYDRAFLFLLSDLTQPLRAQITQANSAASYAEANLSKNQKLLDKYTEQAKESKNQ